MTPILPSKDARRPASILETDNEMNYVDIEVELYSGRKMIYGIVVNNNLPRRYRQWILNNELIADVLSISLRSFNERV